MLRAALWSGRTTLRHPVFRRYRTSFWNSWEDGLLALLPWSTVVFLNSHCWFIMCNDIFGLTGRNACHFILRTCVEFQGCFARPDLCPPPPPPTAFVRGEESTLSRQRICIQFTDWKMQHWHVLRWILRISLSPQLEWAAYLLDVSWETLFIPELRMKVAKRAIHLFTPAVVVITGGEFASGVWSGP